MMEREASEILKPEEVDHWRGIYKLSEAPTVLEFAKAAKGAGDAVMTRMWNFVKGDNYVITE